MNKQANEKAKLYARQTKVLRLIMTGVTIGLLNGLIFRGHPGLLAFEGILALVACAVLLRIEGRNPENVPESDSEIIAQTSVKNHMDQAGSS